MKKLGLLIAVFLAGLTIGGLIFPVEWRGKLSRPLAARIGPCLGHMPDD